MSTSYAECLSDRAHGNLLSLSARASFLYLDYLDVMLAAFLGMAAGFMLRPALRRSPRVALTVHGVTAWALGTARFTSWDEVAARRPPSYRIWRRRHIRGLPGYADADDRLFRALIGHFAAYPEARALIAEPDSQERLRHVVMWYRHAGW